ncbi:hypothetical protein QBC33DRAFT_545947 [Phialemonium atrogriseum]|uniref:SPRY domain-containing protein n=1 Tax=Phialemonium atrogriseum TaxID=1093897 RepID=A0AAJ0BWN1_9PEZI|nr:uncharacterized protein QBC33DRAFT_545947 [Phialemonium atrogriseum]KAK1764778.1 hypothetical protein QBC33DRAFT_545947 [Phialemonium atrogriseum]
MCFGSKKDNIQDEDDLPARPAQYAPPQPTYAPSKKESMPASPPPLPSQKPDPPYHQQQQQQQQPVAELAADDIAPPPGPPPSHQQRSDNADYAPPSGPPPRQQGVVDEYAPPSGPPPRQQGIADEYGPPSGPPPSQRRDDAAGYAPPPGPPPSKQHGDIDEFAPPPGPPPSKQQLNDYDFAPPPGPPPAPQADYTAPPPGPPPSHAEKPKHEWEELVPDTSLFPPPPDIFSGWDRSPAANATEAEAEAGEAWCARHPMMAPLALDGAAEEARRAHAFQFVEPPSGLFHGRLERVGGGLGVWRGRTEPNAPDSCLIAYPPLYAVTRDSPLALRPTSSSAGGVGGRKRTIYYEVRILADGRRGDTSLAMGYTALPYPAFRLPGWHRGSLAVHGDDGHRYVNDRWGGKSFTEPLVRGRTYGLGMTFTADGEGRLSVDVFFTEGGREKGRWNLHEETDAEQDLPVTGLEGFHDLSCAVGTFDAISFEVVFDPAMWLYKGVGA